MIDNSGLGTPNHNIARIHPDNASPGKKRWVNNRRVSAALLLLPPSLVVSGRSKDETNSYPGYVADVEASAQSGCFCCCFCCPGNPSCIISPL